MPLKSALPVHPGPSGSRAGMNARGLAAPPMPATHAANRLAAHANNFTKLEMEQGRKSRLSFGADMVVGNFSGGATIFFSYNAVLGYRGGELMLCAAVAHAYSIFGIPWKSR